jgi:hypothetical protein
MPLDGRQVLSNEQWAEVKRLSLEGVMDPELAIQFGVKTGTIAQRRYDDAPWLLEWRKRREERLRAKKAPQASVPLSTNLVENASQEDIAAEHIAIVGGYTHSKIKEAIQTNSIPAPQSWGELKTATEILRKAVGLDRDQAPVQINLWGGEADGVAIYRDSGPVIETEPDEFV